MNNLEFLRQDDTHKKTFYQWICGSAAKIETY